VGIAAVMLSCFPIRLLDIFSNDPEIIKLGVPYLIWIGIIMFPQSMNIICGNAIRAHGDTKWMLFSQILGSTLVVSISWILIEKVHMNMLAVYITLFADEAIRGGINFIYYRKKYGRAIQV
jgi:Na+-driven multidrug efflux pump